MSQPQAAGTARVPPRKRNGAYYTPEAVAELLVRSAVRAPSDRLLDPACGDGRFLAHHANSEGVERDGQAASTACQRAPSARIHNEEFFAWAQRAATAGEQFDCVVGNPPFIRYQTFSGEIRARALALCKAHGVSFSALSASWAPFLVVAASLLRPGGRLAFVVPAAIGHAPAGGQLLDHLVARFADVRVMAVRRKLFPRLSEDCWLLLADQCGGTTNEIGFAAVDTIRPGDTLLRPTVRIDVAEWRNAWRRRLRPYLLGSQARALYLKAAAQADAPPVLPATVGSRSTRASSVRLGDLATVDLGYVSGANEFFHLTPSRTKQAGIPDALLQTTVRSARVLPPQELTAGTVAGWRRNDDPMLLLRIPRGASVPKRVQQYLDSAPGQQAREAYKCRHRRPWYSVPDVRVPDLFLSYMAGRVPSLVKNAAGASCTNALHCVRLRGTVSGADLLSAWRTPLAQLSCEIEGHPLGGGMLKLELSEAARVLLPQPGAATRKRKPNAGAKAEMEEAASVLRLWRHYAG